MADLGGAISVSKQPPTLVLSSSDHSPPTKPLSSSGKKPRGRPRGSKNKPKAPVVITKHKDSSAMNPVVIEISAGNDLVDSLLHFAQKRHVGLTMLSGSGSVSNVTLRHPMSVSTSMILHGPFGLLSLSACLLPDATSFHSSSSSSFGISLAGPHGQVFGGIVGGKVTAASLVMIVAATFANPAFYHLPSEIVEDNDVDMSKSAIIAAEESPAVATVATSATPLTIVYNTQSPLDHAMPWGRTSY